MGVSAFVALLVFALLSLATAMSGAIFRPGPWYDEIRRPSWTPPNWVFRQVWTVMYTLIAVSGWLVWLALPSDEAFGPMALFGLHLAANFLWSALFFGAKRIDWALIEIAVFWVLILAVILTFSAIFTPAGIMLIPYLMWGTFAGFLNFTIWRLNRKAST